MSDDIQKQDAPTSWGTGSDVEDQTAPDVPAVPDAATEVAPRATGDQPAAGPLTPADLQRVAELSRQVDVSDTQSVLAFGLPAQSRIANFADSLLGDVRTKDAGSGGRRCRTCSRRSVRSTSTR